MATPLIPPFAHLHRLSEQLGRRQNPGAYLIRITLGGESVNQLQIRFQLGLHWAPAILAPILLLQPVVILSVLGILATVLLMRSRLRLLRFLNRD